MLWIYPYRSHKTRPDFSSIDIYAGVTPGRNVENHAPLPQIPMNLTSIRTRILTPSRHHWVSFDEKNDRHVDTDRRVISVVTVRQKCHISRLLQTPSNTRLTSEVGADAITGQIMQWNWKLEIRNGVGVQLIKFEFNCMWAHIEKYVNIIF